MYSRIERGFAEHLATARSRAKRSLAGLGLGAAALVIGGCGGSRAVTTEPVWSSPQVDQKAKTLSVTLTTGGRVAGGARTPDAICVVAYGSKSGDAGDAEMKVLKPMVGMQVGNASTESSSAGFSYVFDLGLLPKGAVQRAKYLCCLAPVAAAKEDG